MEVAFILLLIVVAFALLYLKSPTVIGAAGERRVNSILREKLPAEEYIVLADLTLQTTNGTTQIDHLIVSRYGVFVVETKNMSGWIFGGEDQARWTQVMRRHKSQFQNPLHQNQLHLRVVQRLLGIRSDQLENLVAFVGSAEPKTAMPSNVFWSRRDLLNHIVSRRVVQFGDAEVRNFVDTLRSGALEASNETRRAHVQHVRDKVSATKSQPGVCPRCGSTLIERTNRTNGKTFYGCSRFPKCRGAQPKP